MTNNDHNQEAEKTTEPTGAPGCRAAKTEPVFCSCPEDCLRMLKKLKRPLAVAAGVALLGGVAYLGRRQFTKGGCPCKG